MSTPTRSSSLALVDQALTTTASREQYPADEIRDLLLDIRSAIVVEGLDEEERLAGLKTLLEEP